MRNTLSNENAKQPATREERTQMSFFSGDTRVSSPATYASFFFDDATPLIAFSNVNVAVAAAKTALSRNRGRDWSSAPSALRACYLRAIAYKVEESVKVLKDAAKTRKVAAEEVLSALSVIEKAKIDLSGFFETLGGKESPGRTCMLVFTAEKQLKGGRYFPLTSVQRFDAAVGYLLG